MSGKLDQQLQTLVSEFGWDAALELYFTGVPTSRDALIQRTRVVARMVGSGKTGVSLSKAAALSRRGAESERSGAYPPDGIVWSIRNRSRFKKLEQNLIEKVYRLLRILL